MSRPPEALSLEQVALLSLMDRIEALERQNRILLRVVARLQLEAEERIEPRKVAA